MKNEILKIAKNFERLAAQAADIEAVAKVCREAIVRGGKIMFCGIKRFFKFRLLLFIFRYLFLKSIYLTGKTLMIRNAGNKLTLG